MSNEKPCQYLYLFYLNLQKAYSVLRFSVCYKYIVLLGQKSRQVGASNIVLSNAVIKQSNPTPHVSASSEGRMMNLKEVEDRMSYPRAKLDLTSNAGLNPSVAAAPETKLKDLVNIVNLLDTDSDESEDDLPDLETSDDQDDGGETVETSRAHG